MLKFIATNVSISKGYDNSPALKFSEKGDFVRFRIGIKVFDSRAEKNARWINLWVKGFGTGLCERIRKMQLKEGSMVNLVGRYDEDTWEEETTKEKRSMPVIILDDLEYCFSGGAKNAGDGQKATSGNQNAAPATPAGSAPAAPATQMPGGFTGYEPFGGGNSFFDA